MNQTSIFEYLYEDYKIKKPIRLIELFAGYGSQLFALKYLGANVSSHKIVEWAVPSIQAYKDAHFHDRNDDHTSNKTFDDLVDELLNYGISSNYNEPMTRQQIVRKGLNWCKQVYNNIKNTNNLVNIMNVKGKDLEIEELDKYDYILTYSFPCQDLSLSGKLGGMDENSETRSSMLWQVKRILDELKQENALPQILLMENVPQVIGKRNIKNMEKWDLFLSWLGYKSYIKNMIATDYGIPQIRNRTFMISILGDYSYTFPSPIELTTNIFDYLEEEIDEKLILSDKMVETLSTNPKSGYPRKEQFINSLYNTNYKGKINTLTTRNGSRPADNFVIIAEDTKKGYVFAELGDGVYINRPHQKRGVVQKGKIQTLKTTVDDIAVVIRDYKTGKLKLKKLSTRECFRAMGVKDDDYQRIAANQSNSSLYHLAGDSIVVNVLMAIFKQLL